MTPEQFAEFNKHIDETLAIGIETHVNGKIRKLTEKLDTYIVTDTLWKEEDMKWKEEVKPTIESMENVKSFSAVGTSILKGVLLIGSAVTAVWALFHFIANQ